MQQVFLDEDIIARARLAAAREGFATVEAFIAAAIAERPSRPNRDQFRQRVAGLRERLHQARLTELEILADFERFRRL